MNAGVFALNLNNPPSNSDNNVGFRLGNARNLPEPNCLWTEGLCT